MTAHILPRHKKLCIISGVIVTSILLIVYLYALRTPGFWHWDVFLYRQNDGSFNGSDSHAAYQMHIIPTDNGADISFAVNETTNQYQIINRTAPPGIQIYKNGSLVFQGKIISVGDSYALADENNHMITDSHITVGDTIPDTEELFPSYRQLYRWATAKKYDIRGNLTIFMILSIMAVSLILDTAFPNLFFTLKYRLAVDGGEPSDWYRISQIITRGLLSIGIVICAVLTFTIH